MQKKLEMKPSGKYFVELTTDVIYSQFENNKPIDFFKKLKMDLLLPRTEKPLPLIVFLDGGRFLRLNKTRSIPQLVSLAESGYVVASIEYRVSSDAKFPAQLHDAKAAIRFLRAHADKYNIDPERIGVFGKSAGGTLACLLGTTGGLTELEGNGEWKEYSSEVHAVVDLYGPTDFVQFEPPSADTAGSLLIGEAVHENIDKAKQVSPMTYISENVPPFLILHGDSDKIVPFNQSELFYHALKNAEADVTFYKVEGAGHDMEDFYTQTPTLEIIKTFFDEVLNKKKTAANIQL